jgi:hypothetical protein
MAYKQCKTSLAIIVHNNKPQDDKWTETNGMNIKKQTKLLE